MSTIDTKITALKLYPPSVFYSMAEGVRDLFLLSARVAKFKGMVPASTWDLVGGSIFTQ